jgi:hypothetical protein
MNLGVRCEPFIVLRQLFLSDFHFLINDKNSSPPWDCSFPLPCLPHTQVLSKCDILYLPSLADLQLPFLVFGIGSMKKEKWYFHNGLVGVLDWAGW